METDNSSVPAALKALLDTPPETLSAVAMATVIALAQAWKVYNERPQPKRIGRRGSDLDCELIQASQRKIEKELEELRVAIQALAASIARPDAAPGGAAPS